MIQSDGAFGALWRKVMLRGSAFTSAYRKLHLLYAVKDPWNMASKREQDRFAATNAQLAAISDRYDSILELGCGEGHQSEYLSQLTERFYGIDLSSKAIERARSRCPSLTFAAAMVEQSAELFPDVHFDLICACEVLYYASDITDVLPALMARTDRLYVSNYKPRSDHLLSHFEGPGWRRLEDIVADETVWECFLWEKPGI